MKPPVWRRLRVASDMGLPQFKDVVLAAMGTSGQSWRSDPFVAPWMVDEGYEGIPDAVCLAGRRACPPEDIGGPWGFEELLEWLEGKIAPGDRERATEVIEWLPEDYDPKFFSVAETNEVLEAVLSGEDDGLGEYWEF